MAATTRVKFILIYHQMNNLIQIIIIINLINLIKVTKIDNKMFLEEVDMIQMIMVLEVRYN